MNVKRSTVAAALAMAGAILLLPPAPGIAAEPADMAAAPAAEPEVKLESAPKGGASALRVAILPAVNGTSEVDAVKILEDLLPDRLKEVDKSKAVFLMPADVERTLTSSNAMDRAYRITARWAKGGAVDSAALAGLDSIVVADAVMCVQIYEWESKRFHNISEGQSYTTVGLRFALFGIRDQKRIWTKEVREQRLADEIDLSAGAYSYDATGRYQNPSANVPPRIQEVVSDLVRSAFKKFPVK